MVGLRDRDALAAKAEMKVRTYQEIGCVPLLNLSSAAATAVLATRVSAISGWMTEARRFSVPATEGL